MYKLEFTLKQHTPVIHFQHDQDGATLRASEVKPKLDRFLLKRLGGGNYRAGYDLASSNGWLSGKGEHPALDYKLKFLKVNNDLIHKIRRNENNNPLEKYEPFFGNIGDNYKENLGFVFTGEIIGAEILTGQTAIFRLLSEAEVLNIFFALHNFGTRQSKGFGSFTIKQIGGENISFPAFVFPFSFDLRMQREPNLENFKLLFKKINWFYRSIRSGLNEIRGRNNYPQLYFKSVLFQYVNDYLREQWDKKTIKKVFLDARQQSECDNYNDEIVCNPIAPNNKNEDLALKNFKDLFGLSSLEKWGAGNGFTLKKTQAIMAGNRWRKSANDDLQTLSRFQSPMFFKVIRTQSGFRVFFGFYHDQEIYSSYTNHVLWVEKNTGGHFVLPFYQGFDYNHFMNWVLDNVEIENRFEQKGNYNDFEIIKSTIIEIYRSISENRN